MQPNSKQLQLLQRLANDTDGEVLITFFQDLCRYYADLRRLKDRTPEAIEARTLLCDILEEEVISRLKKKSDAKEITEEYD